MDANQQKICEEICDTNEKALAYICEKLDSFPNLPDHIEEGIVVAARNICVRWEKLCVRLAGISGEDFRAYYTGDHRRR